MKANRTGLCSLSLLTVCRTVMLIVVLSMALFSACTRESEVYRQAALVTGGNPRAGKDAIRHYGCYTCHTIPGVAGAHGLVGPPLAEFGSRYVIAGELPNTAENLERWIQHPRQVEPHTLMPEMGVSDRDSRDIAAYLYTLK